MQVAPGNQFYDRFSFKLLTKVIKDAVVDGLHGSVVVISVVTVATVVGSTRCPLIPLGQLYQAVHSQLLSLFDSYYNLNQVMFLFLSD